MEPDLAAPLPDAVDALHRLAEHMAVVAVVSGRAASFLAHALGLRERASPLRVIGLHGLEEVSASGEVRTRTGAEEWRPVLAEALAELRRTLPQAARVEDKGAGITVHWRSAGGRSDELAALAGKTRAVTTSVAGSLGLVARPGKASVELALPLGIDKGTIVRELCRDLERAGFAGDDRSDLPAFEALDELATTGVKTCKIASGGSELPVELGSRADLVFDGPAATTAVLTELARRIGAF